MKLLFTHSERAKDLGILLLRMGIGIIFIGHGYFKLAGGAEKLIWSGSQLQLFGITFAPYYWGLLGALIEFCGGIALIFGLCTRLVSFLLIDVMIVATAVHLHNGDSYQVYTHPLSLLVIFISLLVMGAGRYSLDHRICC